MSTVPTRLPRPGFVVAVFDVPFPISVPIGAYYTYDPVKQVACVEVSMREGSRAFFRNRPIIGPTSFSELQQAARELERPRPDRSYLAASRLHDGTQKATLNIHTGADGGYAECKYYSQVTVTFLVDDLQTVPQETDALKRTFDILNPFLDKYKILNEDYRISRVSRERNFYFAACHTSSLTDSELALTPHQLFTQLSQPRTFLTELGHGAVNILRTNSFELLGPRSALTGPALTFFNQFVQEGYELPLSYQLIMEAIAYLQRFRDYRLALLNAETAFEVYVINRLQTLMLDSGMPAAQASSLIENDQSYWGVKKKIRQLDEWTQRYCARNGLVCAPFMNSNLYNRWKTDLYGRRNAAVHAGKSGFSYADASSGIGIAKECIVFLEARTPTLADKIQLNPLMTGFRDNAGEVMF